MRPDVQVWRDHTGATTRLVGLVTGDAEFLLRNGWTDLDACAVAGCRARRFAFMHKGIEERSLLCYTHHNERRRLRLLARQSS